MNELTRERWILVEDSPFLPPRGGGEREHLGLLRAALGRGAVALVVLPADPAADLEPYREELGDVPIIVAPRRTSPLLLAHPRLPYVVASRPVPDDLVSTARTLAPDATGVVLSSYKSRQIGEALGRGLHLPVVLRMHNREGAYHRDLAAGTSGPRGWALRWDARRIAHDEDVLGHADWLTGIVDISASDAEWRAERSRVPVRHVPPFAIALDQNPPDRAPSPQPTVLFVGALDVATNTDSVRWLLNEVWPRVHDAQPSATLNIVGRSPSPELAASVSAVPATQLHADVPDVAPFLASAHVAVNPAVSGSGVNIKLVDYLNAGVPTVSTSHAMSGLPLNAGVDLFISDDAAGFAQHIVTLLSDPARAAQVGRNGQLHIRSMLDPNVGLQTISDLMRD